MNIDKYLKELENELSDLPENEKHNALEYYKEYLEDIPEDKREDGIKNLGTPQMLADQIKNESGSGLNESKNMPEQKKNSVNIILVIIIAVLLSPVWIPLLIAFAAIVLSLLVCILTVLICFPVTAVTGIISGILTASYSVYSGLFTFGIGLFFTGITITLYKPLIRFAKFISIKSCIGIKKLFTTVF